MSPLLNTIRHNPLLWSLVFLPAVFAAQQLKPEGHTLLFLLSALAIVPLTTLLSSAAESVAATIGDAVGGRLNATLGNLAELGPIVTDTLFIVGVSFLLGGLKHHVQEFNRVSARMQAALLFLATIALLIPSSIAHADAAAVTLRQKLSVGLAVLLIVAYALGMLYSLKTHREVFVSTSHGTGGEAPWPMGLALTTLGGVTVLVALVSEVFVGSVMPTAFSCARKGRLDLSVGIALRW